MNKLPKNGLGNWNVIWKRVATAMRALTIVLTKQVVLTEKTSSNIKKRRRTTKCHLSPHTILRSVIYPTSFVSTGQPYENTQNCAKSSKNHPSWLSDLRLLTDFVCLYTYEFWLSLCKIVRSSVILLLPLFTITMPNVTAGGIFFPRGHCNLVALLKHLWITKLRSSVILLLPLFTIAMPNVTAGGIFFPPRSLQLGSFT
jgi:hypothetical protein